jgi:hypothetical protein
MQPKFGDNWICGQSGSEQELTELTEKTTSVLSVPAVRKAYDAYSPGKLTLQA